MVSYTIDGVNNGSPVKVAVDTTSQAVSQAYLNAISVFATLYNEALQASPNTYQFTSTDYANALAAYQSLVNLAQSGVMNTTNSTTNYINFGMAENLQLLMKTFETASDSSGNSLMSYFQGGATSSDGALQALQSWFSLAPAGLANVLNGALTAGQNWQSIQAMIELQFVQAGNNQISSALGQLQSALTATDSAVNFLTQLQNLYNDVTPASAVTVATGSFTTVASLVTVSTLTVGYYDTVVYINGTPATIPTYGTFYTLVNQTVYVQTYPYTPTGATFVQAFIKSGDSSYSSPITVTANPSDADIATFNKMLNTTLPNLITQVMQAAGYSAADISAVLANPGTAVPTSSGTALNESWDGSLGQLLSQVYSDMKSAGTLTKYIIDNQAVVNGSVPNTAGDFGRNLAAAEVAAQSLNTTQQQQVQQQLYLFQQFYQSASGVLTALSQIIQNMAQASGQ